MCLSLKRKLSKLLIPFIFISANAVADDLTTFKSTKDAVSGTNQTYAILQADHQAMITSELSAKIVKLPFRAGDSFKQGDTLIEFACDIPKADLKKSEAELSTATIALESAKKLQKLDSISQVELAQAQGNYNKAQADVSRLSYIVSQCKISAPYPGSIVDLYVHMDEIINPNRGLMKIVDNSDLTVKLFVPSVWLEWLKLGAQFSIHLKEMKNHSYEATVTKIGAEVDTASQTVAIYGKLNQPDSSLISGMSGSAEFKEQHG